MRISDTRVQIAISNHLDRRGVLHEWIGWPMSVPSGATINTKV
jgi:hypothetical protein